jgi:pyroglutamyl-peptidase
VFSQPFRAQNPINPSWEITRLLPPFLTPAKSGDAVSAIAKLPPVRILIHPEPVRVAYKTVRELVPKLWEGRKIDYMVHIGMASGRRYYSVERKGHRDGYSMRDVDDLLLGDTEKKNAGEHWAWEGLPAEILSDTNIDDVWRRWRTALPVNSTGSSPC